MLMKNNGSLGEDSSRCVIKWPGYDVDKKVHKGSAWLFTHKNPMVYYFNTYNMVPFRMSDTIIHILSVGLPLVRKDKKVHMGSAWLFTHKDPMVYYFNHYNMVPICMSNTIKHILSVGLLLVRKVSHKLKRYTYQTVAGFGAIHR